MPQLILHVGTHKTGSTSLQKSCASARPFLRKFGVHYPKFDDTNDHRHVASAWIGGLDKPAETDPRDDLRALNSTFRGQDGTLFLSSEEFSRLHKSRVDFSQLRSLLSSFDRVKVICVLREQTGFAQSVFQQIKKRRPNLNWHRFLKQSLTSGTLDGLALDFNDLYDHLLTGFAPSEIEFLNYEDALRHEGGSVQAVMRHVLPEDAPLKKLKAGQWENKSTSALALQISSEKGDGALDIVMADKVQSVLDRFAKQVGNPVVYTREQYETFTSYLAPRNASFAERLAATHPDFALTVPRDASELLFADELDDAFWAELKETLARLGRKSWRFW